MVRVLQTCAEMVTDRGYCVMSMGVEYEPPLVAVRQAEDDEETLHVIFHPEDKVGVKAMRAILSDMDGSDVDKVILVSTDGPTPFTRRELGDDRRIEFWTMARLVFNITKFNIVPKHSLVAREEEDALRRKYHVKTNTEWPKLPNSDPVCRYYDFPVGRIVRIDRAFGHFAHPYYRMIVAN